MATGASRNTNISLDEAWQRAATAYQSGDFELAKALFAAIVKKVPDHAKARNYLGVVSFQLGDRDGGLALLRESCRGGDVDADMLLNCSAGVEESGELNEAIHYCRRALRASNHRGPSLQRLAQLYLNGSEWAEAVTVLDELVQLEPRDPMTHVRMTRALFEQGRIESALSHGETALRLRDEALPSPSEPIPEPPRAAGPELDVLAFSLWGDDPKYLSGALANAELARVLFPDWTARFYCDSSIEGALLDALRARGAEVVLRPIERQQPWLGLFWRFEPADDPTVRRFLCRDVDSRLSDKERAAVDAWVQSGLPFHVMRDHVCHLDLVLAGMWGAVAGALPPLAPLVKRHVGRDARRWVDQAFLRHAAWPIMRGRVLVHDSYYRLFGAEPFPVPMADKFPCRDHIGSCVSPSQQDREALTRATEATSEDAPPEATGV